MTPSGREWPSWWNWDLALSVHVLKRMTDRGFGETDLRTMLEHATGYRQARTQGRWVVETRHRRRAWEVIVEPDDAVRRLVVVTAYPVE